MKQILCLALAATLFACNPEPIAKISGTIANEAAEQIIVTNFLRDSADTISISEGTFSASIDVAEPGMYNLSNGKYGLQLYLKPGTDITINLDIEQLKAGAYSDIVISGKGSGESAFMLALRAKSNAVMKDLRNLLSLPADSFKTLMVKHNEEVIGAIDSFKRAGASSEHFYERISLIKKIENSEKYMYYDMYHARLAPKDTLPIPDEFKTVGDEIPLDNKTYFEELKTYKYFVLQKHDSKMGQFIGDAELEKGSVEEANAKFDYLIKLDVGQEVKDILGNRLIGSYTYENDQVKEVYASRYAEVIKDEKMISEFKDLLRKLSALKPGSKAPTFAYRDINGDLVDSEELKGKVVYIDVWATWCGPCMREIPFLKKLEEELHGLDVAFVSISIDGDKNAWQNMVAKKELKGYQLFAEGEWSSDIVKNYAIKGIPRFILIDKKGNLVNANADRPSSNDVIKNKLIELAKR